MQSVATKQTYNGWKNRETWLVNLWLTNDEGSAILEEVARMSANLYDRADWLEQSLRDQLPHEVGEANMWSDLLGTALDRVNWYELAAWADN